MKKAIFVEGLSEMAFVYQMLLTHYDSDWTQIRIDCFNLHNVETTPKPDDYGMENAPNQFLLRNVGNDESVVSCLLEDFNRLHEKGYEQIVGLRDVYGENYKKQYGHSLKKDDIATFMEGMKDVLGNSAEVKLHFAIMEVESWMLAIAARHTFSVIDSRLSSDWIKKNGGVDVEKSLEYSVFHPAVVLSNVMKSVGKEYSKHWDDIKKIIFKLEKEDFEELYRSKKNSSYCEFYDTIFNS